MKIISIEPCLMAPSLIQSPLYFGQFSVAWENGHTFPCKKKPVNAVTRYTANSHILKNQTVESLIILPR